MLKPVELWPFQARGRDKIINDLIHGLFFRMGFGKTLTVLHAIHELMWNRLQIRRVLVLAPKKVARIEWPKQIDKWTEGFKYTVVHTNKAKQIRDNCDIYIMSYSSLPWLYKEMLYRPKGLPSFDMVVYDESTYLKNESSKRWQLCEAMFADVKRAVALAGKPAPNGQLDWWAQIYLLDRGARLFRSFDAFRSAKFISCGNGLHKRYEPMVGAKLWIQNQLADLVTVVTESEHVKLPPIMYTDIHVDLTPSEYKEYKKLEHNHLLALPDDVVLCENPAASMMKLRQYSQGFVYTDTSTYKINTSKIEALEDIVLNSEGCNILCAVQFVEDVLAIQKKFKNTPAIYGATTDKEAERLVNRWNDKKIPLLIVNPTTCAHGLNIQDGGHIIVWYGLTWNLDEYDQLNARLYRAGQTMPVSVHHIVMKETIDEVILSVLKRKDKTQMDVLTALNNYRYLQQIW